MTSCDFKGHNKGKAGWTRMKTLEGLEGISNPYSLKGKTNQNTVDTTNQNAAN
jgi:hypothetical protein